METLEQERLKLCRNAFLFGLEHFPQRAAIFNLRFVKQLFCCPQLAEINSFSHSEERERESIRKRVGINEKKRDLLQLVSSHK